MKKKDKNEQTNKTNELTQANKDYPKATTINKIYLVVDPKVVTRERNVFFFLKVNK